MGSAANSFNVNQAINRLLNRIAIRAETNTTEYLYRTFVNLEQIASGLQRVDHQVMYGRRGRVKRTPSGTSLAK